MSENGKPTVEVYVPAKVGDEARIETPAGTVKAVWLGTVSDGKELAAAMRRMAQISQERQAAQPLDKQT